MHRSLARLTLLLALSLAGCASQQHWVVDNQVDSMSKLAQVPAGASYRFDPSPAAPFVAGGQAGLEALAAPALERAGLRRADNAGAAQLAVELRASAIPAVSPNADPWRLGGVNLGLGFGGGRGGFGFGGIGFGFGGGGFPAASDPWYAREVGVLMRDAASGQVVFESHARNEGPYGDSNRIFPVMFEAALSGFPNPPLGTRRVDIDLADRQAAAPGAARP